MKGHQYAYSNVLVDDAISMFEHFGDTTECDGDTKTATDIINLDIDI